jgi:hypothetical protein
VASLQDGLFINYARFSTVAGLKNRCAPPISNILPIYDILKGYHPDKKEEKEC